MSKILYRVMVKTPDRSTPVEPFGRPKEQAEGIAKRMGEVAKRAGWNYSYFIEVCDGKD